MRLKIRNSIHKYVLLSSFLLYKIDQMYYKSNLIKKVVATTITSK